MRRRKWIILQAAILVPAAAVAFSLHQQKLYRGCSDVLLSRQNLAASLTNTQDPTVYQQADRIAQTQADLARVPTVAQRTLRASGVTTLSPEGLLGASSVTARQNADLLTFCVTDGSAPRADRLATEYARQFTIYRRQLDTGAVERARSEVQSRIVVLEAAGDTHSPLYASLVDKEQQLSTMEALLTSNAYLVQAAGQAAQVQPRPVRNGILGLALGLVLGIGLAFLWEALDTRLRSAEEITERLGLPLLARLMEPPKRLRARNGLVMLAEPNGVQAEGFRMLRTNLEFVNLERGARTIMVTSAVQGEGKSTTIANLAVALARAGKNVVLVDLDLRRPAIDRFFGLDDVPGVTEVALGHATLEEALISVAITDGSTSGNGNGHGRVHGTLEVLTSGPIPPDAGEFVATQALEGILEELRDRADVVLIDAPPLFNLGDAMTLSARVDALVIVTRLDVIRRPMANELHRVLGTCPATKLGFVLTGAELEDGYGYGGTFYYRAYGRETEAVA